MIAGTIKSLKLDPVNKEKSYGFVTKNGTDKGYYFIAGEIQGIAFPELKVGDAIEFKLSEDDDNKIAHLVKVCNNQDRRDPSPKAGATAPKAEFSALRSTVVSLTPEPDNKGYGFILALDKGSNYHFTWAEVKCLKFSELKVGDEVEFDLDMSGNRKVSTLQLASHVNRLTTIPPLAAPESLAAKKPSPITKSKIIESLIDALRVIPEMSDPNEFEDAVFMLLKMLGISNVFQYGRTNQAGKADGFFHFQNLAVLYDCTLREDFFGFKEEQIDNYVGQLSKSPLTMHVRSSDGGKLQKKFPLDQKNCHVWIITAGKKTREISDTESIRVKEVTVQDLIKLAKRRLHADTFDGDELLRQLVNIEHG